MATGLMALVYALVPNNVGANLIDIPRTHGSLVYQARLRTDVDAAVSRLGRDRLLACGSIMTEGFQVPNVAFAMNVPLLRIDTAPTGGTPPPPPNVIFQTRATRSAALLPRLSTWPTTGYRLVLRLKALKIYASCAGGASL